MIRSLFGLKFLLLGLLYLAVLLAAYSNHFHNPFHFDDLHTIVGNVYVRSLHNIPEFFRDAATFSSLPTNQAYRPIVTSSIAFDYWMGRGDPFYFHLTNFTLYVVLLILLYVCSFRLIEGGLGFRSPRAVAGFIAALYGLHTANAETINYIIARSDSISTLFFVATFAIYIYWRAARRYGLYLIPLILALLTKEPAVVFPIMLFIYHWLYERREATIKKGILASFVECSLVALPALTVCASWYLWSSSLRNVDPGVDSRWPYLITQPFVIFHYALNFILPVNFSADTDWKAFGSIFDERAWAGFLFVAWLVGSALHYAQRPGGRPIAFGIIWFLVALLPTSSVMPLSEILNDHRPFFPYIGLCLALVTWFLRRFHSVSTKGACRFCLPILAVLLLLAHAVGVYRRNVVWSSDENLWREVTERSPLNGRGLMNYGLVKMGKGEYPEALRYFERAKLLLPNYSYVYINLGVLHGALKNSSEAERNFNQALALAPNLPEVHFFYARWLFDVARLEEARREAEIAATTSPAHMAVRELLREIYGKLGDLEALRQLSLEFKTKAPDNQIGNDLAWILDLSNHSTPRGEPSTVNPDESIAISFGHCSAGRFDECYRTAAGGIIKYPHSADLWNNMAVAFLGLGLKAEAVRAATKAVHLNPQNSLAQNNLAAALK